ncbi:MAG: aerotolerance regulator BatB [Planctomycetes bacterium]|nr:aerotolerance regulator BatB [Planctomycetota bacterium]
MSARFDLLWADGWPLLLLVPVVWWLLRQVDRGRGRRLAGLVGPRGNALAPDLDSEQRRVRRRLTTGGLACALVAVLQPTWGTSLERVEQRGVDVLVCLDVSRSMLARDLRPSRLERARREIEILASRVEGDRLGLVAFAGDARLVAPLTRDAESFTTLLRPVDTATVIRGGTDLGAALEAALSALEGATQNDAVVVLLTDGEDLGGRGLRVAERCRRAGIVVHCVGFGSEAGAKIPIEGPAGETYLQDPAGDDVVTALEPESLRRLAEATGGEYVDTAILPQPLLELYEKRIVPMTGKARGSEERRSRKNRFQWPLLVAVVLGMFELMITDRRRQ